MTTQTMINDLNVSLVNEQPDITIANYVKQLSQNIFNIDISFIDDFIELVDNDDYIIHHDMLDKYDVLKITDTSHVKRLLQQHDFEDGVEYISRPTLSGGQINYFLKPKCFKIILIRSRNTKKIAEYYIFLEDCIKYYNDFEKIKT